jgi:flagellar biosynthesis/type III secretory pathway protein FliH
LLRYIERARMKIMQRAKSPPGGFTEGHTNGYDEGYEAGKDDGYDNGF